MEKAGIEKTNNDLVTSNLPILASELLLWPNNRICIISGDFDDRMVNRNEFEGHFNGYFQELEETVLLQAVSECSTDIDPIDLARPLIISAELVPMGKDESFSSSILKLSCGATGAWNYDFAAKVEDGKIDSSMMFVRNDKGLPVILEGWQYENLFIIVRKILARRVQSRSKVELTIR